MNGVKKGIAYLMNHSTDAEIRDFLRYGTASPTLVEGKKIILNLVGDFQDAPVIDDIPIPAAHGCGRQLDINVNTVIQRDELGIGEGFFKEKLEQAIKLVEKHGNGLL